MKLLLDEQISAKVADALRKRGHDVIAASADPALRGASDPDLFDVAQVQRRALVTFNIADFVAIARERAELSREHHGLVFVHPTRFSSADFGALIATLAKLLAAPPVGSSFVVWLQPSA